MTLSRVTRTRDQARAAYDRLSRWYDLFSGGERRLAEAALRQLKPQTGERALEIGPGTGHALAWIASEIGAGGLACGLDLSPRMLAETRGRAGLRTGLVCGDGARLPWRASAFDLVFLSFTLELFDTPEIPLVLRECARVMRAGGRICVVSLLKEETVMVHLYEAAHRRWPDVVDCRPIRAGETLRAEGFGIISQGRQSLWGLPVEIVIAKWE